MPYGATGGGAGAAEEISLDGQQAEATVAPTRWPKRVIFIIVNEFCERFSYYGLKAILQDFFWKNLGFDKVVLLWFIFQPALISLSRGFNFRRMQS